MDTLLWYARRFRAMSLHEVGDRGLRAGRHRIDAATYTAARTAWRRRWQPDRAQLLGTSPLEEPLGPLRRDRALGLRERFPSDTKSLVARADDILADRYSFFGYPEVEQDDAERRDVDPFTGSVWPDRHAKRIDYRRSRNGDPKWIWELNRCQRFPVLVAAGLVTGDDRYGRAAADRLVTWVESHPPGRGIAWSSGFEAGVRALSLAVSFDGLRGSGLLTDDSTELALRSLWQHARWIDRDPSTGSSANNHRLGELVGLVAVGCLAPELAAAPQWLEASVAELERQVDVQIASDGTTVEQAFPYQVFVVDLLTTALAVLESTGQPLPPRLVAALERSGNALWALLADGEPDPTYGDGDDGRALVLDGRDLRDGRGVAAAVAAGLAHAKAARAAGQLDATAWWLFGPTGEERLASAAAEDVEAPGSLVLADAGITVLRSPPARALFDHGPHGYLSIAAHAHADALRVDYSHGRDWLVVDPGSGSYFARPDLHTAFRSTAFHATVTVDGLDSSTPGGPFLWTRHAAARLLWVDLDSPAVVAEHTGYELLEEPVSHRRAVVLLGADSLLVVDRLVSRGTHQYSQRWPLHPSFREVVVQDNRAIARNDETTVAITAVASSALELATVRGRDDPVAGWWSSRLESYEPSWLVAAGVHASGEVVVATLLDRCAELTATPSTVTLHASRGSVRVDIARGERADTLDVDFDSPAPRVGRAAGASA
jgi:uncharacterized heparinase superfamily protein